MESLSSLIPKYRQTVGSPALSPFLQRLVKARSGIIAVVFALAAIPVIMSIGGALDYGRAHILKTRLGEALDKAALAVGATTSTNQTTINRTLNNYFNANFDPTGVGRRLTINSNITDGTIRITATGSIDTAFLKIIGVDKLNVRVSTEVVREATGLEVALVLDNTGSMRFNNRIGNLRTSALELVDILFQDEDRPENVRIGLVPFVTTVNIGRQNELAFIRNPNPRHVYPNTTDREWKGCVEARPSPNDVLDTFDEDSNRGDGRWDPYFWESEPLDTAGGVFLSCTNTWWLPNLRPRFGITPPALPTGRSPSNFDEHPRRSIPARFFRLDTIPPDTQGPNKACPDPITPLTNDRRQLRTAINAMQPWSGNGTMAHLGAAWGWRVLSPEPPFDEGSGRNVEGIRKALIILTDGVNLISPANANCARFVDQQYDSHYTGYGYLSEDRLDSDTFTEATAELNDRLRTVCNNIRNDNITVYTITFELEDPVTQNLFRECASRPDLYFPAANAARLKEAFRAIGAQINSLRISQ